jgi:hypothetical protein
MVHDVPPAPAPLPRATTRLATATVGDLRAARACVEVTHDRIAIALHKHDERLDTLPPDHLIALSDHIAALEAAAGRVLRHVDPDAAERVPTIGQLCRDASPQAQ